jgi:hypothetical protein
MLLTSLIASEAFSQRGYNSMKSKKVKAQLACPLLDNSQYPYHGIGIKLGDPFAITYKFYLSKNFGIVVDFGKAASGLYNKYYREKFGEYINVDTAQNGQVSYLTHSVKADWVGELKFLWHFDAERITPGLKIYFGVGPEVKMTELEYKYIYTGDNNSGNFNELGTFTRQRNTFGPQVSLGIEYSYFQIPISAFMEIEMFNDVSLDPGWRRFEGGVGLRYIFK